ncbi:thiamine phosphate synthase [Glycomyces arizonensis]|uniref:thiamine phosphate synthase n=1 Tax=Glycomyces arizonensis TaxID=256035 RepID=UPI0004064914|nr:thiamine phosphate synthase [Glycomyces arizonensis]
MAKLQHRLIVVTDVTGCPRPLAAQIGRALRGGPFALLLRDKHLAWEDRRRLAERLEPVLAASGAELVVADPPEAVRAAHLSAAFPVPVPRPACLGRSVHAGETVHDDLDYITYSPIWASGSKPGYGPPIGLEGLAERVATSPVPVYALGGVTGPDRALAAREAGAAGVAVMGAVMRAREPERVVAALRAALEPV